MKKTLIESMQAVDHNQLKTPVRKNRVEFLALKDDIAEALEKGWSMTIIWETLRDEGSFTATYNTFRLYVLKYLNGQKPGNTQMETVENRSKKLVEKHSIKKKAACIPSFTFNPKPNPEELL